MKERKNIARQVDAVVSSFFRYSVEFCRIGIGIWGAILFSILGLIFSLVHLDNADDWCFKMVMRCEDIIC